MGYVCTARAPSSRSSSSAPQVGGPSAALLDAVDDNELLSCPRGTRRRCRSTLQVESSTSARMLRWRTREGQEGRGASADAPFLPPVSITSPWHGMMRSAGRGRVNSMSCCGGRGAERDRGRGRGRGRRTKVPLGDLPRGVGHLLLVLGGEVVHKALLAGRAGLHHAAEERDGRAGRRARVLLGRREVHEEVGLDERLGRDVEEGNVL